MNYEKILKDALNSKATPFEVSSWIEEQFPELSESEDEKIRKWIVDDITFNMNNEPLNNSEYRKKAEKAIAWLEKQQGEQNFEMKTAAESLGVDSETYNKIVDECIFGEQKPANKIEPKDYSSIDPHFGKPIDKVEPKFHEGEWIVHHGTENIYQVVAVIDNQYQLKYGDNYTILNCADVDRCARLWDITKDAKDGDVLADNVGVILFRKIGNERYVDVVDYYCVVNTNGRFKIQGKFGYWGKANEAELHPATKEQRDLLFRKMKESGYEWNSDTKELKKIEPKPEENKGNIVGISANWSEEDEKNLRRAIRATKVVYPVAADWLKSLRPQNKWKPSEEQMEALWLYAEQNNYDGAVLTSLYNDLKKLKEK